MVTDVSNEHCAFIFSDVTSETSGNDAASYSRAESSVSESLEMFHLDTADSLSWEFILKRFLIRVNSKYVVLMWAKYRAAWSIWSPSAQRGLVICMLSCCMLRVLTVPGRQCADYIVSPLLSPTVSSFSSAVNP